MLRAVFIVSFTPNTYFTLNFTPEIQLRRLFTLAQFPIQTILYFEFYILLTNSVTRCTHYLFNIGPLRAMKNSPIDKKCQRRFRILPNNKLTLKIWPKTEKNCQKAKFHQIWSQLTKSVGHYIKNYTFLSLYTSPSA